MKAFVRLLLVLALVAPALASAQTGTSRTTTADTAVRPPSCRLAATATVVPYNTRIRLDWVSINATAGQLTDVGQIGPRGYVYVVPGRNTTYAATFVGPGGSVTCRVGVAIYLGTNPSGVNGSPLFDTQGPEQLPPLVVTPNTGTAVNQPVSVSEPAPTTVTVNSGVFGGLVPAECRGKSTVANCDICSLGQMIQNIINFLLGLTIPAAALLFAWAGILYFSARGVPDQLNRAHKIFKTVIIGFLIAIAAYTLVNTVINMLVSGAGFKDWSWKSLSCTTTRILRQDQINRSINEYLSSSLPGLTTYVPPVATPVTTNIVSCDSYLGGCFDSTGKAINESTGAYASNLSAGPAGACKSGAAYDQEGDLSTAVCVDEDGNTSKPLLNSNFSNTGNFTSEQKILLSSCAKGDLASCESFSSSSGSGQLGQRITDTIAQYKGFDTSAGPEGGNKACAWAVNNILMASGIAPIDGDSVALMQQQLINGGRGELVGGNGDLSNTSKGDIVVWKTSTISHVGICENDGCTKVVSNSSANAKFNTVTDVGFNQQWPAKVYHVTK